MNGARVAAVARLELRAMLADPLWWGLLAAAAFATLAVPPQEDRWLVTATVENVGSGTVSVAIVVLDPAGARRESARVRLPPRQPQALRWAVPFAGARVMVDPDLQVLQLHRREG